MKKYRVYILMLFFLGLSGQGFSNNRFKFQNKLKFYNLTVENGLSNNNITSILQDSVGFLWFGTTDGLSRYDGANFLTFRNEYQNQNSLCNNDIQCMYYDNQHRIWIGTDNGLDAFSPATNTFTHYGELFAKYRSVYSSVISLDGDSRDNIFAATADGNLLVITSNDSLFLIDKDLVHSRQVRNLALENDTALWVSYPTAVERVNVHNNTKLHYDIPGQVNLIYLDNSNNVWIGAGAGLWFLANGEDSPQKVPARLLSDTDITSVKQDADGLLWIGTRNGGLNISKAPFTAISELQFDHYLPRNDMQSVSSRTVLNIFEDKDNNMWLGTFSSGVNFVNKGGEKIVTLTQNPFDKNSLSHKRVWGICEDHQGNLWIGADGGGLNKFDPYADKYTNYQYNEGENSISDNSVLCLLEDSQGFLWIGTYLGGLNRFDPETEHFKTYKNNPADISSIGKNDVRTIFEDSKKRLWIGLNGGGLNLFHPETEEFEKITSFTYADVRSMVEDKDGGLWVATNGRGLIYYHHDEGKVKAFSSRTYPEMDTDRLYDLVLIDNEIWMASRNRGLIHYNIEYDRFSSYSEKDGLINNNTKALLAESDHEIWISTSKGISLFDIDTKTFINYGSLDGVQAGEFNPGSTLLSQYGYICFGGNEGLNVFSPERLKRKDKDAKVVFTGLRVFDQPLQFNWENTTNAQTSPGSVVLNYDQNVFTIDFIAIDYPYSNQYKYSYILENYDREWWTLDSKEGVTYRNLPPGRYTFKVKALANNDLWESSPRSLEITIKPPFWKTIPAFILYFAAGAVIIYIILSYYTRQVKLKSSLYFEKKLRSREHELNEERLRFFTNFSHELRTPLTLILAPLNDLIKKSADEGDEKKLNLIRRNALQLSKLIDKLLEFRKAETGSDKLSIAHHNMVELVAGYINNFVEYAHSKNIELHFDASREKIFLWIDAEKIRIVLNNLLSNAFKYTPRHGKIRVSINDDEEQVTVSVQDSGQGIKQDDLSTIFNWYYSANEKKNVKSTGLGLAISRRYVEMHHGELKVESGLGKGSRFYFSLMKQEDPLVVFTENELALSGSEEADMEISHSHAQKMPLEKVRNKENDQLILLIDDNHDVLEYLNDSLGERYKIVMADNGEKGVKMAFEHIPDLIISDVMMPVKTGLDLCRELKQDIRTSHIPIMLLTAKTAMESVQHGYEHGADEYISKPFDMDLLKIRAKNLIANRSRIKDYLNNNKEYHGKNNKEEEFLNKLNEIILRKSEENEATVNTIAHELGFSRPSLYRKLKAITDMSINEYIRQVKIKKAEALISSGEMNISEAAFYMGFNDIKHFRSVFKKQTGKLPSEIKKQTG